MSDLRNVLTNSAMLILTTCLWVPAANAEPGEREGGRGGPPQEAFDACVDKVEGDACSFSGRRGDVEGSCIVPPRGEESLVCAPAGGPPEPRHPDAERLTWEQTAGGLGTNWEAALDNAAAEMAGTYGEWRLPAIEAFQGLVDDSDSSVAGDASLTGVESGTAFSSIALPGAGTDFQGARAASFDPEYAIWPPGTGSKRNYN